MSEPRYAINFGLKQTASMVTIVPDFVEVRNCGDSEPCLSHLRPGNEVCVVYAHYEYADKFNSMVAGSVVPLCVVPELGLGIQLIRQLWAMLGDLRALRGASIVALPHFGEIDMSFMDSLPKNAQIKLRANTVVVR